MAVRSSEMMNRTLSGRFASASFAKPAMAKTTNQVIRLERFAFNMWGSIIWGKNNWRRLLKLQCMRNYFHNHRRPSAANRLFRGQSSNHSPKRQELICIEG